MSGDGLFSKRYLSRRKQEAWVQEHNPHEWDSAAWWLWKSSFHLDQAAAVWSPRRSWLMFAQVYVILPAFVVCIVVGLIVLIVSAVLA